MQTCVESWDRAASGDRPRRRAGAFSLIELLVVVTIIIALLAILTPSMNRAVEWAQWTVCASNMDQLTTGILSYAMDNWGFLLGGDWTLNGHNANSAYLWVALGGAKTNNVYQLRNNPLVNGGYLGKPNHIKDTDPWVYRCPSDTRTDRVLSYSSTDYINGKNFVVWADNTPPAAIRLSQLKAPAGTIYLVEENNTDGSYTVWPRGQVYAYQYWRDYVNSFHMGDGNTFSFLDGHVLTRMNEDPLTKTYHMQHCCGPAPNSPDLAFVTDAYAPGLYVTGNVWNAD